MPILKLPYFDYLLASLQQNDEQVKTSFGRHVHWGYWQNPKLALLTTHDFAEAAENLTIQVCGAANIAHGQTILDVGCGFGGTIAYLNESFSDLKLMGLNLDDRQLMRAQQLVKARAENKILFQQADACALPFKDNSFDVVLAVECIFHFPDRQVFFQEVNRVLKPGGLLAISDFVPVSMLLPVTKLSFPQPYKIGFYGVCNVQYDVQKYRELAATTGFQIQLENDITANTLPTYAFLRRLGRNMMFSKAAGVIETLTLEIISRLRLMKYMVYAFRKL